MAQLTETGITSDWLKWLTDRGFCIESRVIAAVGSPGLAMYTGDVLEVATGTDLKALVSGQTDAVAILMEDISATESQTAHQRPCLVRGPARIDSDHLVFSGTATSGSDLTATLTAFAALDIRIGGDTASWSTQTD